MSLSRPRGRRRARSRARRTGRTARSRCRAGRRGPRAGRTPAAPHRTTNRGIQRTRSGLSRCSPEMSIRGRPTIHSSPRSDPAPRVEQNLDPLVWSQQPEEQDDRPLHRAQRRRQRPLGRLVCEVLEGAVVDDVDLRRVDLEHVDQGCERRTASERSPRRPARTAAAAPRAGAGCGPWEQVVRGQHERAAREQVPIDRRAPSATADGRCRRVARAPAVRQHVRNVLGGLGGRRAARSGARRARAGRSG